MEEGAACCSLSSECVFCDGSPVERTDGTPVDLKAVNHATSHEGVERRPRPWTQLAQKSPTDNARADYCGVTDRIGFGFVQCSLRTTTAGRGEKNPGHSPADVDTTEA